MAEDVTLRVRTDGARQAAAELGGLGAAVDRIDGKKFNVDARPGLAQIDRIGKRLDAVGMRMQRVGSSSTRWLSAPVAGAVGLSIKAFADFDSAMTNSLSVMGDVSPKLRSQMEAIARDTAIKLRIPATDAAASYRDLASSGMTAVEAMKALPAMATVSKAGMIDMQRATDMLTDAQTALGLSVRGDAVKNLENLVRVTDVLAAADNAASATIEQFGDALTNRAGAALRAFGKDVEEGVAVLAVLADRGVKGQEAGEGLAIVLRDLQRAAIKEEEAFKRMNVAVFDSDGKMRHTADIIEDLDGAFSGLSDKQKRAELTALGFLDRNIAMILPLLGTSKAIRDYEKDLDNAAGATEKMAQKQLKSFTSGLQEAKREVIDTAISLGGTLAPAVTTGAKAVRSIVDTINELPSGTKKAIGGVAALAAAFGPLMFVVGGIGRGMGSMMRGTAWLGRLGRGGIGGAGGGIAAGLGSPGSSPARPLYVVPVGAGLGAPGGVIAGGAGPAGSRWGRVGGGLARGGVGVLAGVTGGVLVGGGAQMIAGQAGAGRTGSSVIGGVAGGAVAGATIGSVVPGVGTVTGAIAGAAVGGLVQGFRAFSRRPTVKEEAAEWAETIAKATGTGVGGGVSGALERVKASQAAARTSQASANVIGGPALAARALADGRRLVQAERALGRETAKAFLQGQNEVKFPSAGGFVAGALKNLRELPPAAQREGGRAMIAWARGMEAKGQLPKGTSASLVAALKANVGAFADDAKVQGGRAMVGLSAGMRQKERAAVGTAERTMEELGRTFGTAPKMARTEGFNVAEQYQVGLKYLRNQIRNGRTPEMRAAARDMYRKMAREYDKLPVHLREVAGAAKIQLGRYQAEHAKTATETSRAISTMADGFRELAATFGLNLFNRAREVGGAVVDAGRSVVETGRGLLRHTGGVLPGPQGHEILVQALPGETVLTRHQKREIDGLLGSRGAVDQVIGMVRQHHSYDVGGEIPRSAISGSGNLGRAGRTLRDRSRAGLQKKLNQMVPEQTGMPSADGLSSGSNVSLGRQLAARMGWTGREWAALHELWTRESGWRTTADNPSSDAYGIPQSLPGSKMASAGADWKTNPATQIRWGIGYIRGRYGTPSAALAHHDRMNWYHRGGVITSFDQGGGVDSMGGLSGVKPNVVAFYRSLVGAVQGGQYAMSGFRAGSIVKGSNRTSLHASGMAVDIGSRSIRNARTPNVVAPDLDRVAVLARKALGHSPVIAGTTSNDRGEVLWRTMQGGNHYDHVHVGLKGGADLTVGSARGGVARSGVAAPEQTLGQVFRGAGFGVKGARGAVGLLGRVERTGGGTPGLEGRLGAVESGTSRAAARGAANVRAKVLDKGFSPDIAEDASERERIRIETAGLKRQLRVVRRAMKTISKRKANLRKALAVAAKGMKNKARRADARKARTSLRVAIRKVDDDLVAATAREADLIAGLRDLGSEEDQLDRTVAESLALEPDEFSIEQPSAAERITGGGESVSEKREVRDAGNSAYDTTVAAGGTTDQADFARQQAEIQARMNIVTRDHAAAQAEYDRLTAEFNRIRATRNRWAQALHKAGPRSVPTLRRNIENANAAMRSIWADIMGLHELIHQLRGEAAELGYELETLRIDQSRQPAVEAGGSGDADALARAEQAEAKAAIAQRRGDLSEAFISSLGGDPSKLALGDDGRISGMTVINVAGGLLTERELAGILSRSAQNQGSVLSSSIRNAL